MDVSSASSHMLYRRLLDVVLLCGSAGVGYIIAKKCPLSHDVMTLKTRVSWETLFSILWPPHSVLRKIIFAGLTTAIRRWRCSPERAVESYPSDRNTVSGSEPTLSRTSCSPSTVCFLFIHWHNSWTKLPPNDWRPSTDSDWRLNWTYTLKPQTPTVILDLVTAVWWMCRYWKWLTKLFRRLSSDIYVIMLTHLYVDTGSW